MLRLAPTTEALRQSVHELEIQKAETESRLEVLRSGSIKPVSAEEKYMGEAEYRRWEKKALSRQKIWKEAEGIMLEAMTREELYVSQTFHVTYASAEYKFDVYRTGLALTMSHDQQLQESFGIRRNECNKNATPKTGLVAKTLHSI